MLRHSKLGHHFLSVNSRIILHWCILMKSLLWGSWYLMPSVWSDCSHLLMWIVSSHICHFKLCIDLSWRISDRSSVLDLFCMPATREVTNLVLFLFAFAPWGSVSVPIQSKEWKFVSQTQWSLIYGFGLPREEAASHHLPMFPGCHATDALTL